MATLAFDELVGGWTSEFTFTPDSGLSLNNNYYTFHNGRIWRHNSTNVSRNNFYGVAGNTTIEFVFNDQPTLVKNFKTLGFEGQGTWTADLSTNVESGSVQSFILKEGKSYSWIRGNDLQYTPNLSASGVGGIGEPSSVANNVLTFSRVPNGITAGDQIYTVENATAAPQLVGLVSSKTDTTITYTQTGIVGNPTNRNTAPTTSQFFLYAKENQVNKSGIIGYYTVVTMTSADTGEAEIFSANTKSFISTK